MIVLFIKEDQLKKITDILRREEVKIMNVIHTDAYSSVCVEVDLPFELSSLELVALLTRVLIKQGYRQICHGSAEHSCVIFPPFSKSKLIYFTKK
ncbi:MAG: hypothetical protein EOP48_21500 [Sphingobacteriales bacterium]|nr:MAG: hypothetical protein EOP48_21500 [Sphingobacteriales bacterium]